MAQSDSEFRGKQYAQRNGLLVDFDHPLGAGIDGTVWKTNRHSAIKILDRQENYERERDCYERLLVEHVIEVNGFSIPKLIDIDDQLMVVEMEVVVPPFVLDFGKCYLDRPPDFSAEVMADCAVDFSTTGTDRHLLSRCEAGKHHVRKISQR